MAYIIGNLLGRLIMSAFIVWAVLFLMKRFDYKVATKSLKKTVLQKTLPIPAQSH